MKHPVAPQSIRAWVHFLTAMSIYFVSIVFEGLVVATEKMTETRPNTTGCNWTISCSGPDPENFQLPVSRFEEIQNN
jgi:hypothetical protein